MRITPRRIIVAAIVAGGLALFGAPAAHAVVDPVVFGTCLVGAATEATTMLDLAGGTPAEVPLVHCLAP
ncbi:hypothetical protein ITP53_50305 [Nonomuraea sp. K274]|uniref:Uncharacterized protein n=1 Tax=Nonomuraea cypriaca TaxID=1187855 RepID=A0A931AIZ2_9ACTN|nr:hypothetical protein [Nonomuraea cypriaca]MBF8193741.1 hypothetical protein [Nonomuraea cypriaca]